MQRLPLVLPALGLNQHKSRTLSSRGRGARPGAREAPKQCFSDTPQTLCVVNFVVSLQRRGLWL